VPEGSFEPMVMFFGLTNLPAIFQGIINDLLRDLVVEGKVAVFIDDVVMRHFGHQQFLFYFLLFF